MANTKKGTSRNTFRKTIVELKIEYDESKREGSFYIYLISVKQIMQKYFITKFFNQSQHTIPIVTLSFLWQGLRWHILHCSNLNLVVFLHTFWYFQLRPCLLFYSSMYIFAYLPSKHLNVSYSYKCQVMVAHIPKLLFPSKYFDLLEFSHL